MADYVHVPLTIITNTILYKERNIQISGINITFLAHQPVDDTASTIEVVSGVMPFFMDDFSCSNGVWPPFSSNLAFLQMAPSVDEGSSLSQPIGLFKLRDVVETQLDEQFVDDSGRMLTNSSDALLSATPSCFCWDVLMDVDIDAAAATEVEEAAEDDVCSIGYKFFAALLPSNAGLNFTMTAVMLSHPVPSPSASGAKQCSNN